MPSLPETYKAAVLVRPNEDLKVVDTTLTHPKNGEILVQVLACGICHSDFMVKTGVLGNTFPRIPGHEFIGTVMEIGKGSEKWKTGDRVGGMWHGGHDGVCRQCQRGQFQMCVSAIANGVNKDGGYAQYVLLRSEAAVRIPLDVDPAEYAPILCAGVTVFNSMRRLKITAGELIAVQGLGGLGHLAVQYANKLGFKVIVISSGDGKHDFARELGAHDYIDASNDDPATKLLQLGGAAMIVSTAPNPQAIAPLIRGLQAGGHLLSLAPVGNIEIDTFSLVTKGASVSSYPAGHALDAEEAIEFARLHDIRCMVEKFSLADAQEAWDHTLAGDVRFRSVLVMD